ncbi:MULTISPECIES: hypothetical protein [Fluviispira]|uniref:Mobilization protein n=1 Tax=Fluviispira sanaruensis TaxID=2493639 RepID=A0A4P2VQH9_FLUSA|nr:MULTISPECIES: hypothetical protein [Fluviispira]BBH54660.1 hypothetical protein JCM31447_31340 [Fluviispira sanaruensis]
MEEKETTISIRLNANERDIITAKASKFRMKPSSFVREFVIETDRFVTNEMKIENQKLRDEIVFLSKKVDKLSEHLSSLASYIVKSSVTTSIYVEMASTEEKKSAYKKILDLEIEDAKAKKIIK